MDRWIDGPCRMEGARKEEEEPQSHPALKESLAPAGRYMAVPPLDTVFLFLFFLFFDHSAHFFSSSSPDEVKEGARQVSLYKKSVSLRSFKSFRFREAVRAVVFLSPPALLCVWLVVHCIAVSFGRAPSHELCTPHFFSSRLLFAEGP